jgi:uncharacterized protein (DUF1501 family)
VPSDRFRRRLDLLGRLEGLGVGRDPRIADHQALYRRAARIALSPRLDAFALDAEPAAVREAYGPSEFGRGCLLARRLLEAGVSFVEVRLGGWDTHQDNFDRSRALAAQVDPALAQLIRELRERGRLESTLIVWMGEFGRTPRINGSAGRDHFPRTFTVAMAGGGIRGGRVIGKTSADGQEITERPVTVPDFFCTICRALVIDPHHENQTSLGRPIPIVESGAAVGELFA